MTWLTACTPGSTPGPTLGVEYGKPLPLPFSLRVQVPSLSLPFLCSFLFSVALFCRLAAPKIHLRGLEERCKLPSRIRVEAPTENTCYVTTSLNSLYGDGYNYVGAVVFFVRCIHGEHFYGFSCTLCFREVGDYKCSTPSSISSAFPFPLPVLPSRKK